MLIQLHLIHLSFRKEARFHLCSCLCTIKCHGTFAGSYQSRLITSLSTAGGSSSVCNELIHHTTGWELHVSRVRGKGSNDTLTRRTCVYRAVFKAHTEACRVALHGESGQPDGEKQGPSVESTNWFGFSFFRLLFSPPKSSVFTWTEAH